MGFAIAEQLAAVGALVELVAGPVNLTVTNPLIHRTNVNTAEEMYDASLSLFPECNAAILCAAVADYRSVEISPLKLKKKDNDDHEMVLKLVKNKDILAALGNIKRENQLLVGFSLETHNEFQFAQEKLKKKNLDLIIMNSLKNEGAGFSIDTNMVSILSSSGERVDYPKKYKNEVAKDIVDFIITRYF